MRKFFSVLLALAMILVCTGCGETKNPDKGKTPSIAGILKSDLVASNEAADEGNGLASATKVEAPAAEGDTVNITSAGEYELDGEIKGQVVVNVPSDARVKLILNGVSITTDGVPCVYVKNADKVTLSCADGTVNTLTCTGTLTGTDDGKNLDGAVFARDDLKLSGHGILAVNCEMGHGIVAKDDLDIKNLSLDIKAGKKGIQVNDCCTVMSGKIRIKSGSEGIEAFVIDILDGDIDIVSGSDGLNATDKHKHKNKTDPFKPGGGAVIYIKSGTLSIDAGGDGIDSNGDLFISGGDITVYAFDIGRDSAIDYAGNCEISGGILNLPEDYGQQFMHDQNFHGFNNNSLN